VTDAQILEALRETARLFKEIGKSLVDIEKRVQKLERSVEQPDARLNGLWRDPHEVR
jgi:chaperonin cofactor prefoldin